MLASRLLTAFALCSRAITPSTASMRTSSACSSAMRLRSASRANAGMSVSSILQQVDEIDDAVPPRGCNGAEFSKVAAQCID